MKSKRVSLLLFPLVLFSIVYMKTWPSVRTFTTMPEQYHRDNAFEWPVPVYDASKKNVFIVTSTSFTELFDMMAPFYLFNVTEKANVYIVAEQRIPIPLRDGLYALPHLTFDEVDSLRLAADVIVIPFLGVVDTNQNPVIVRWIKDHFGETTKILSVCDGAATAAATGLYDGKPLTCHASDFSQVTPFFPNPEWVQNVSVTKSGNLYSTAGVSNAVEGSLLVIQDLYGSQTTQRVMANIHYASTNIQLDHKSIALDAEAAAAILSKLLFGHNHDIGVLLQNGANELHLAALLDSYSKTFPASFHTVAMGGESIETMYGLTLISTNQVHVPDLDEVHVLSSPTHPDGIAMDLRDAQTVSHDDVLDEYPFDAYLRKISDQYGRGLARVAAIMLDHN